MENEKIISQLVDIYYENEWWHNERLSRPEAHKYHDKLLSAGNIITVSDGDILAGYVEYWRLSFEQFGRIICGEPFSAMHEDVSTGQIAYVANTFIREEYRNSSVAKQLRDRFLRINEQCTHFAGTALRKSSQPIKVFKKEKIYGWRKKDRDNAI